MFGVYLGYWNLFRRNEIVDIEGTFIKKKMLQSSVSRQLAMNCLLDLSKSTLNFYDNAYFF